MSTLMYCEGLPMVLENAFQINDSAAVMMSDSILTITTSWNNVFIFEKQTPTICTLEYMPVCGIDWVTYGNACAAAAAKIAVKSEWECVISESCIQKFDGCNMCTREPWGEWACTEMYCEIYSESYCKDNLPIDETNQNLDVQTLNNIYVWVSVDEAITEASKRSTSLRVVEIDGKPQAVTMDYRPWRINATTVSGFVTSISIE